MSNIIDLEPYDNEPAELEASEVVIEAVSPKVSTEAIEGGHRVTVTDIDGEKTFDVMDGERGLPGLNGLNGQDGETPLMMAVKRGTTTTVTFSTSKYQEYFQIEDGEAGTPGRNGISPKATVTKTGDTATIRIEDLSGVTTATVSDGATGPQGATGPAGPKGDTGPAGPAGADYVLTSADKAEIAGMVDVSGKMNEPATEGTAGQVLTTDGQGGRSWTTVQGGGGDDWELIGELIPTAEASSFEFSTDTAGKPFVLKKAILMGYSPIYTGESTIPSFCFTRVNGNNQTIGYTSAWKVPSKTQATVGYWLVEASKSGLYREEYNNYGHASTVNGSAIPTISSGTVRKAYLGWGKTNPAPNGITSVSITGTLVFEGCKYKLYGVRW